jgi:hypothetical protein
MFTHIKIHLQREMRYFIKAAGKFALLFLRFFTLGGKLLKILMPA